MAAAMSSDLARVVLKNDYSDLPRAHGTVAAWLRERGAGEDLRFDADLVLEEIVTNLIKYAWPEGGARSIAVEIGEIDGHAVLAFEDDGVPFDPWSTAPPEFPDALERRLPGGMGLHLVRTVSDRIDYDSDRGVNRLAVRLRRPLPSP